MIAFILNMPGKGSWNNKWSGEEKLYVKFKQDNQVPKEYVGQSFSYRWPDGWEALVTVEKIPAAEANKLKRRSAGFCGYDWMIDSIINYGYIITSYDYIEEFGTEEQKYILNICQLIGVSDHDKDYNFLREFRINRRDLETLVDNNIVSISDEVYSGGPTIKNVLKFMNNYKDEIFIITAKASNKQITFLSMCKNRFDNVAGIKSAIEMEEMLKHAPGKIIQSGSFTEYNFE